MYSPDYTDEEWEEVNVCRSVGEEEGDSCSLMQGVIMDRSQQRYLTQLIMSRNNILSLHNEV